MHIIEKLHRDDENHEVFVVCEGHKYRITTVDCGRLGLEEGVSLSDDAFEELSEAEARLACIQKAFVHLSYGDMSKKRLIEKLSRAFDKALCRETADLLEERGYLNDARLAERYAENYYEVRSYGPMRIKQELYAKGFSLDVIEQTLEPYRSMDHREKIAELLEQKFSRESLSDMAVKKKAVAWLNRCGYSWSDVSDVLNDYYQ